MQIYKLQWHTGDKECNRTIPHEPEHSKEVEGYKNAVNRSVETEAEKGQVVYVNWNVKGKRSWLVTKNGEIYKQEESKKG